MHLFISCCQVLTLYCADWQDLLGLNLQELHGVLTSSVTITKGEEIKRHYNALQAQGQCPCHPTAGLIGRMQILEFCYNLEISWNLKKKLAENHGKIMENHFIINLIE